MSDERLTKIETLLMQIHGGQAEIKEALRGMQRDLGRIESRVEQLDDHIDQHRERIVKLEERNPPGSNKIAAAAGGAGVGIGAAIDWILHFINGGT